MQVPPDGQPIILMADRQTTGGYPKIAHVASVDLPLLAQMHPHRTLRFALITLAEAQQLYLDAGAAVRDAAAIDRSLGTAKLTRLGIPQMRIDLNCDMGESFGAWTMGHDTEILDYVSSANIACGFHAGDPATMHRTVEAALARGVAVGAHPGLPDLQGFGRRTMSLTATEAYDIVVYQVGAIAGFARALGGRVRHVKPHGALYNMAAKDTRLAAAIVRAVRDVDADLVLFGLAGSAMIRAAEDVGLRAASEVFADRTYQDDGSLTSRSQGNAMIEDIEASLAQIRSMVIDGAVRSLDGKTVRVRADTLCIHGDQPGALAFVKRIRSELATLGIGVAFPADPLPAPSEGGGVVTT